MDSEEMYKISGKRTVVVLQTYGWSMVENVSVMNYQQAGPSKKLRIIAEKISEVELIVKKLKEKHKSLYSVEKLNAWAHMIDIGKHKSHDAPPDLPYFHGKQYPITPSDPSASSVSSASPSTHIDMGTQLLSQMEKWHSLLEKGGIT